MKKILLPIAFTSFALLGGCAAGAYAPGGLYTQQKAPVTATGEANSCAKKGEAEVMNILGLVAIGDASVETARAAGGITTISSVDYDNFNILGLFSKTKTIVCGK